MHKVMIMQKKNHIKFQKQAKEVMEKHFDVRLVERKPNRDFPKKFDMVSPSGDIVGDAKFLTLVRGERLPSAKFMEIAGHVWLLEKVEGAKIRFLVFGNQREVPKWWLRKYGNLVQNVRFYFLDNNENLTQINRMAEA